MSYRPIPTPGAVTGTTATRGTDPDDDWRNRAACLDEDPEDWFPEGTAGYAIAGLAFDACRTRPVRIDCLEWALQAEGSMPVNCRAGIWGGATPTERHNLYRERAAARGAAAALRAS